MFSKKSEQISPKPAPKPMASNGSTFSVIGADVTIKGDIAASADLHVDGTVEGDLACASLVQGETSRIEGAIKAENARLAGTVKGAIEARELIVLKTAHIEGDVHYDAITIEQGATVEGRFAHAAAKQPGKPSDNAASAEAEPAENGKPAEKKDGGEPRLSLAG